jgi:cytochrome P450
MATTAQSPRSLAEEPRLAVPAARGGCPFAPPPALEEAGRTSPLVPVSLWDGSRCWLVTTHREVKAVLADQRFSADVSRPGFPFLSAGRRALGRDSLSFIRMDDPDHARLRRMLTADFTIRRTERLRPEIERITGGLLDALVAAGPPADLVAGFALPLPSLVICLLLGVPYADHAFFQEQSRVMLSADATVEEVGAAQQALLDYLTALTRERRRSPDDGILSALAARDDLDDAEIASMGRLLLVAGHETTANMIALGTLALLRSPGQLAALREDPGLIRPAVEELLRYLTIVHGGLGRVAVEDVEIGGVTVRAGEGVLCALNVANRDAGAYQDPDVLDLARDARRHVAFGFGVHQCLGQPLARVELQVALNALLARLPGLRLAAPFEEIRFRHDMLVYGVHALPVAW